VTQTDKQLLEALLAMSAGLEPVRCAVVHPCEAGSLQGALEAGRAGLIVPVLVGPEARIREVAAQIGVDLNGIELVPAPYSHAAADIAVEMAVQGQVEALMKGSLHTDELMHAALSNRDFRTKRRMSHIFRFEVPLYDKPLLITDAALNIRPTLADKVDIVQNAIELAQILGVKMPRVAILSAVETVNPAIPSTLDAAALCKMADRKQITNAILDGPLAFDSAISGEAAAIKQIDSVVAGVADILVVPDLESGNMLAKQLEYLAGGTASGVVMGGRVPVALTSRADGANARIASALLAQLIAHHHRQHRP
jgi:phosphate acetyltransferase